MKVQHLILILELAAMEAIIGFFQVHCNVMSVSLDLLTLREQRLYGLRMFDLNKLFRQLKRPQINMGCKINALMMKMLETD